MAFIFKIKLDGSSKPPIWRKVKVSESFTFLELHCVIQGVFNWENIHLFQFSPQGWGSVPRLQENFESESDWDEAPFSDPETWPYGERYDSSKIKLEEYWHSLKQKMVYIYDFGDDWRHIVELVEVTDEKILNPFCMGGKAQAPVEDCGGIWGYYHMVEALNDSKHPEHKHWRDWMDFKKGQKWDENAFDLDEVQEQLRVFWETEE
ncbi:plasmid pRiA4b ORF-3 family protein [Flavobacteriaceae bacterium F89]|uniref:Plasmid pRiA4b ORF-3 family protein n=1 Tax=Cerina litoralis TaxID=2874477 RepID=A0AAE3EYR4_9FLAO|nr:plasmid pRiA4b ORF-3 family protein [Cerina litoralis]MCG2462955.1 plasmid pRiA4b ORF-3 family protein [Cerina litoralis]